MWLLPVLSVVSRLASHVYYRLSIDGGEVPPTGPVLLVANHPNSLFDPLLVAAAARRPVRFLAKAPLFTEPRVGFLIRAAGAIPVYRRIDDPAAMARNVEMFSAVYEALAAGSAVGVFPEGTSHSDPALAPLKTGAARMALGGYRRMVSTFPIIPIGLVLRRKDVFRSAARVIVGDPIDWSELAPLGPDDPDAAQELTTRVNRALRRVTVNLEQWADGPIAECAVQIWEAERHTDLEAGERRNAERVARLEIATTLLSEIRREGSEPGHRLLAELRGYQRLLQRLRLRPADLGADVSLTRGTWWTVRHLPWLALPAALVAVLGAVVFWPPYRVTGLVADLMKPDADELSTHRLLVGIVVYGGWVLAAATLAMVLLGPLSGLAILAALPAVGMSGLLVRERWRGAWHEARRFFLLRSRRSLVAGLTARQRELAADLEAVHEAWRAKQ